MLEAQKARAIGRMRNAGLLGAWAKWRAHVDDAKLRRAYEAGAGEAARSEAERRRLAAELEQLEVGRRQA